MKKYVNGKYIEMTQEEINQMREKQVKYEHTYINSLPYDELVNKKIRERYTESQEFAILRQKDEKPEEYVEYYQYCEECKERAKQVLGMKE